MLTRPTTIAAAAHRAAKAGSERLLDAQHADGRWEGIVRCDPAVTAQFLLAARYVNRLNVEMERPLLAHLDRTQLPGGGWAAYPGGPPSRDVSLLCYAALRFAGRHPDSEPMRRAREVILARGGLEAVGFVPRFPLVFWSQVPLSGLTYLSPKLLFLPRWVHPNLHDLGIFMQPLLTVGLLLKQRAARLPSPERALTELRTGDDEPRATLRLSATGAVISRLSKIVDLVFPARWLDHRVAEWLTRHQNSDGLWVGMALFTTRAVMALYATDPVRYHDAVDAGVEGMTRLQVTEGVERWQPLGHSPILDTAIAAAALLDAEVRSDDPRLARAFRWLLSTRSAGGGWSFASENARAPDTDTTLHVLEVLARAPRSLSGIDEAIDAGIGWLLGMQDASGGWAMWSADLGLGRSMVRELELNGAIDVGVPDVTARVVRALVRLRDRAVNKRQIDAATARALVYLKRTQRSDGSWPGRWAVTFAYGTAQSLTALAAAGDRSKAAARAREFLYRAQQEDGGWGESPASDDAERFIPGPSTVTQTSLAMLGLLASQPVADEVLTRGTAFLLDRERNGTWDEETFCQTVLPGRLHFQNSLFASSLAVMTLARVAHTDDAPVQT